MRKQKAIGLFNNKQVILSLLVMIMIIAGAANYVNNKRTVETSATGFEEIDEYSPAPTITAEPTPYTDNYFTSARMNREQSRSKALELLQETATSNSSSTEAKYKVQEEINKMSVAIEREAMVENLIKAKGFSEVVAFITDDGVDIVVKSSGLTAAQTAQIKDIVIEKVSVDATKIKIVEVK